MKFSDREIEIISYRILENLKEKGKIKLKAGEAETRGKIAAVLKENRDEEIRIEEEVKRLLKAHEDAFKRGEADYKKIFAMAKREVAKKRGFIL